jgi:hypothetical protein
MSTNASTKQCLPMPAQSNVYQCQYTTMSTNLYTTMSTHQCLPMSVHNNVYQSLHNNVYTPMSTNVYFASSLPMSTQQCLPMSTLYLLYQCLHTNVYQCLLCIFSTNVSTQQCLLYRCLPMSVHNNVFSINVYQCHTNHTPYPTMSILPLSIASHGRRLGMHVKSSIRIEAMGMLIVDGKPSSTVGLKKP